MNLLKKFINKIKSDKDDSDSEESPPLQIRSTDLDPCVNVAFDHMENILKDGCALSLKKRGYGIYKAFF